MGLDVVDLDGNVVGRVFGPTGSGTLCTLSGEAVGMFTGAALTLNGSPDDPRLEGGLGRIFGVQETVNALQGGGMANGADLYDASHSKVGEIVES